MAIYAIGDVQGCYASLMKLLEKIEFNPPTDTLWFVGDVVSRGSQSLEVLRFIKSLDTHQKLVLGNHDLNLIALSYGVGKWHQNNKLEEVLSAKDKFELIDWLRHQPLLVWDEITNYLLVHAGLAPSWSLQQAIQLSREVEQALRDERTAEHYLKYMYGDEPVKWDDNLQGIERLRCITNYLTRMRYCYADGSLNLTYKGTIAAKPAGLIPWFDVMPRANKDLNIIFGHWAALEGKTNASNLFALDTGCVWGRSLTAMRLSDRKRFCVNC